MASENRRIGNYQIIKKIGSGNYGSAYICTKTDSNSTQYVLKQIRLNALNDHDRKGAIQEADLLRRLSCPCIVKYVDSFEIKAVLSIVMEYCDGGDLTLLINQRKSVGKLFLEDEIKNVLCQISIALLHCHKQNIVHRDIKTSNIFLCKNGRVKLGDFGVSKVMQDSNSMAETQIGTPYYLSPEICKGEPYNHKSDIWALGCTVYEMMNFHRPFEANGLARLVISITNANFKPLSPKYSNGLRDLIQTMFEKEPNQRPSSVNILNHDSLKQTTQMLSPLIPKDDKESLVEKNPYAKVSEMLDDELNQLDAKHTKQFADLFAQYE